MCSHTYVTPQQAGEVSQQACSWAQTLLGIDNHKIQLLASDKNPGGLLQ
jgi:hypothetical protein